MKHEDLRSFLNRPGGFCVFLESGEQHKGVWLEMDPAMGLVLRSAVHNAGVTLETEVSLDLETIERIEG